VQICGTAERHGDQYLNVAHIFTADGRELTHAKTHIFPAEANWSTSEGEDLRVIEDVGPARIAIETCYEMMGSISILRCTCGGMKNSPTL
jgi:predicted amidohydrolase